MKKAKSNFTLRIDSEQLHWLEARAKDKNSSAAEVIREAIESARTQESLIARLEKIEADLRAEIAKNHADTADKLDAVGRLTHKVLTKMGGAA